MADSAPQKKDPTVTSKAADPTEGAHPARPINEADDYAGDRKYEDMPDEDKPAPETVAQYEVPPTSGAFAEPDPKKDS